MATEADIPKVGENFSLSINKQTQVRINSDAVRELLADEPEKLAKVCKEIDMTVFKTSRHTGKQKKFEPPNLANATLQGLIDMLGQTREDKKDLEKLEGIYKDAIEARIRLQVEELNALEAPRKK